MIKPLLVWWPGSGELYQGEHAEIMRLAYGIPDHIEVAYGRILK